MACTCTYELTTGYITGWVDNIIPESQPSNDGEGLIRFPDTTNEDGSITISMPQLGMMADIAQTPPVLIPILPS